jgi:hypothetical protein
VPAGVSPRAFFFFLPPGGLLHKQGPRRSRIRGDPLPHSHNTPVVTPCFLQEGQEREQEVPHNTKHLPLFSRGGLDASWSQPSGLAPVSV